MKKYLMTGVAAVAFAATLTSCSKAGDLYDEGRVEKEKEQAIVNSYEKAFEAAFGKVGANVDWGFSSKSSSTRAFTRAVGTYKDYKGDIRPVNVTFPEDTKDASKFLAKVPGEIQKIPADGNVNGGSWFIDNTTAAVNMYTTLGAIYVNGDVDFTSKNFEINEGSEIYIPSGSRFKLDANSSNHLKATIYIASGATLETSGDLKIDNTGKVYNHGTIICSRFEVNNTAFLYNVGTLTSSGEVYIANSTSRIVNDGTINSATTNIEGSGALQNNAEWNVTGNTIVSCTNGGWVNNGHWTTRNYGYTAGSENVINNCFLEVTNDFDMNISSSNTEASFKIDTGGGVKTKNFNGGKVITDANSVSGPYKIVMGQESVFKVTETATLEGGNPGWGFFGPAEGKYAVFQAKNVVRNESLKNTQGAVTYGGNLYVSAETHFAQGHDGSDSDGHYFINERGNFSVNTNIYAAGFKPGKPSITIPETPCSPGFIGVDPLYRVIAEDLTADQAGDFDFNDVVFDVVKAEGGKTTLKLICAGGTLPLRVRGFGESEGREVHEVFGDTTPILEKHPMYNTGAGPNVPATDFTVKGKYVTPAEIKNIKIEVYKNNSWMELKATTGEAACKILVDDTFKPVTERRSIANEYKLFTNYVQGAFQDDFWWK